VLASRATPGPLAVRLPRQTGLKEQRYAHLLAGEVLIPEPEATSKVEPAVVAVRFENERLARLEAEIAALRADGAELRKQFAEFKKQFE